MQDAFYYVSRQIYAFVQKLTNKEPSIIYQPLLTNSRDNQLINAKSSLHIEFIYLAKSQQTYAILFAAHQKIQPITKHPHIIPSAGQNHIICATPKGMGCGVSKTVGTYYEQMMKKIQIYSKAKYKQLSGDLSKQQLAIDEDQFDDLGLFMTAQLSKGQRQPLIEKIPKYGRETPMCAPKSLGHYTNLIYQMFGWPFSSAVIDLSPKRKVSSAFVTSLIFAMNTIDITRSVNFSNQTITEYHSSILAAFLSKSINLQFLSMANCGVNSKSISNITEGLLRLARGREKIEYVPRSSDIQINDQEAFLFEVPKYIPVYQGLRGIDLSGNGLSDFDGSRLIDALMNHTDLEFIGLANNSLGEDTCAALYELLQRCPKVKAIDLSGNEEINDKCLGYFYKAITKNCQSLEFLYVDDTGVSKKYEARMCELLARNQACYQIYEDIINGVFARVFNTAEMAGKCHGKGSDQYVEYCVSQYYPKDLTIKEQQIMTKLYKEMTIQESFVKQIAEILANEKEEVNRQDAILEDFTISLSEMQGRRPEMEDVCVVHQDFQQFRLKRAGVEYVPNNHYEVLICLFDGHGGVETAQQAGNLFPAIFADTVNACLKVLGLQYAYQLPEKIWNPLMYSVFQRCDETLKHRKTPAGSTGVVCLILESWIVTANAGDSRAILVREEGSARRQTIRPLTLPDGAADTVAQQDQPDLLGNDAPKITQTRIPYYVSGQTYADYFKESKLEVNLNTDLVPSDVVLRLSFDHKPELPEEKRRVESVGGYIHQGRILSTLAVARGLGDHGFKPSVGNCPYVRTYHMQPQDCWLLICCDGVWDVLSDVDAALLTHRCMTAGVAAITLRDEAFRLDSGDNISSIATRLFFK